MDFLRIWAENSNLSIFVLSKPSETSKNRSFSFLNAWPGIPGQDISEKRTNSHVPPLLFSTFSSESMTDTSKCIFLFANSLHYLHQTERMIHVPFSIRFPNEAQTKRKKINQIVFHFNFLSISHSVSKTFFHYLIIIVFLFWYFNLIN